MAREITMPALSPSMNEGTLVKWRKQEGDTVKEGEIIAEVETDKATMDLEAFDSGTLIKILQSEGSKVAVNARIGWLGEPGEKIDESQEKVPPAEAETSKQTEKAEKVEKKSDSKPFKPSVPPSSKKVKASPLARKIAKEKGVNLAQVRGTGPDGRILKRDVLNAPAGGGSGSVFFGTEPVAKEERQPLSTMRQTIARRLLESKTQIPHFYLEVEADVAELVHARKSMNAAAQENSKDIKLSLNDFVLKACVEALRKIPKVNASFAGDAIEQFGAVHLSFALALPEGLITPVIRDAHAKSIFEISAEVKELSKRARDGALKPEEYTGGTFTVSNLGMMGIERFSAIINPPQSAILAVGNVVQKPVVNETGQIVPGQRMSLTLSCDHRVVDGALGAEFLKELKTFLENPSLLIV